jgi:hypothetical protein
LFKLALQSRLRKLLRNHRSYTRRLAETHCRTRDHHLDRNAATGSYRSHQMTVGIMPPS